MSSSTAVSPYRFWTSNVEVHHLEFTEAVSKKLAEPEGFELEKDSIKVGFDVTVSEQCAAFFRLFGKPRMTVFGWDIHSFEPHLDSPTISVSLTGKPFGDQRGYLH